MATQSPTENLLPNWKRAGKVQSESTKSEQDKVDKKPAPFKVSDTAKPILEEQALLKEKLKSQLTWKKDKDSGSLRRKNQPMVARPISPGAAPKQIFPQQSAATSTKPPSPPPRRRTNSPSNSFNAGTSRSSSPLAEISPEFKRNIEKATRARLYLLHQVGPNSFLIGGDSPNHKFKVIIGSQTCTCGKSFCVHLLFVMLRVFKVKDNDPVLWNSDLKNYEVEGLFSKFHARVNSRLAKNTSSSIRGRVLSPHRFTPPPSPGGSHSSTSVSSSSDANKDEEEVCPICLLEMVEGESLTCCKGGCNNRLHQHCMEIWAMECKTRKERLNCPLCRRILTPDAAPFLGDRSPKGSPLSPNRTVSPNVPTPLGPEEVITLPHSNPIPTEQIQLARPWIQVFGENVVSCMFSREWSIRETALRRLSKDLNYILTNGASGTTSMTALEACCSLLSMMCGDRVYKVYFEALRTFRVMLGLTKYTTDEEKVSLQALLRPVIETIMSKCSDGNRRISALSIKVLLEICKDQTGDLELGRMLEQNQHQSLGGLGFMLTCILSTAHEYATWPWWLGRLCFLHRLLEEFVELFRLQPDTPEISIDNSVGVIVQEGDYIDGNAIYSDNMTRLMSILRFAILAGQCSHTMVSKLAISILLCCTSLAASCPSAFVHIKKLVSQLKPSQRSILQRRLATLLRTTSVETSDGDSSPLSEVSAAILDSDTQYDESSTLEISSRFYSTQRIGTSEDESSNLTEAELLQSIVESLQRPNFLCLNLPRNASSPTHDLESLDWSRSDSESPRLPPAKVVIDNKCQKMIEEEEAEAVAKAMEVSVQERGPQPIPSLRPSVEEDEMVIVYTQPETMEKAINSKHLYMENIHWKKGELLGTGAFSSCYAARDVFTGSLMAVKQVSFCRNSKCEQEKVCQSIMDEISILGRLRHPHLIKCLGATKHMGHFNIFLEWMAGGSISVLLSKYGSFEEATLIRYTRQILQGVAYLHQNQVIHRDIKGANILVDSTGQDIRIADFGAAGRLATQITGAGEFQGQLLGTIAFMAPEVLRGESYGRSCDVWSVGCLLVEMATGKPPWNAHEHSNHLALIFKIACATAPPEIPDYLNPAIRDVLLRCFEHKPEDRPPALELLKHPLFTQVTRS